MRGVRPLRSKEVVTGDWSLPGRHGAAASLPNNLPLELSSFVGWEKELPRLRLDAPVGGGPDWPGYAYVADTVRSLLPMLEQMGLVTAEDVDIESLAERLCAEVVSQQGVQMLPIVIGAWTRKP